MWTVRSALAAAREIFERRGVEEAALDAELLLAHALSLRRIDLFLDRDRPLGEAERARFRALVRERANRTPTAYLTGEKEFFSIPLEVTRDVLIPRPETELLVEVALEELERRARAGAPPAVVADLGTGSGAIAVAVAKLGGARLARVIATDAGAAALAVAKRNVVRHGVSGTVRLVRGDLLEPIRPEAPIDILLSNPPYVALRDRPALAPEVLAEPPEALFSGEDGLFATRAILRGACAILAPGGLIAIEIGSGSAGEVTAIAREAGLGEIATRKDLAGVERVVLGRAGG
jgi:release factor glutamine methyltransferase